MTDAAAQLDSATSHERVALPLRGDTFLGVCEALGQDFHVPADLLRIAFAALFFWSMIAGIATYLAIGAFIALARWLYPARAAVGGDGSAGQLDDHRAREDELSMAA